MPRVLHVISGLGIGGAEGFLASIVPLLEARGIEQRVVGVAAAADNSSRIRAAGVAVDCLGVTGPRDAARGLMRLAAIARDFRPDVFQGWMYHGDLFALLARSAARAKTARLMWNIRCSEMRLSDYAPQLRLVVRSCAFLSSRPDVVIANSRAGADAHVAAGYRPRRLEIIPNGVDVQRFHPDPALRQEVRRELGLSDAAPVIVHVARVDPMKDHALLLKALEKISGATAILAGKGTEALAAPPAILGLGPRTDVARIVAAGDVVVSSSRFGEGFSNALAEGMSAGLVPVTTDVGDARAIVGATGEIVPPGDADALAAALTRALDLTPSERAARGREARSHIESNFSLSAAADRYAALYRGS